MYSATSLKSVVPIALVVQSSMILNVLPNANYFPRVIRIFFRGVLALGPPATLNEVNQVRLPERRILVHRPSLLSRDHESACRFSAFCFSVLGILHESKCSLFNSAMGGSGQLANTVRRVRVGIPVSDVIGFALSTADSDRSSFSPIERRFCAMPARPMSNL